jgi:hypothetical protein
MRPVCTSIAQRTRVYDAAELNDAAVACALDDAAVVEGDGRVDKVAAQRA